MTKQTKTNAMKPFKELIDFESAKKIIMDNTSKIKNTEIIPLNDAYGRVLAVSVTSSINVPGFKRGAMDGYAVIAKDTFGASRTNPKQLQLIGKVFAGQTPNVQVNEQTCIQISTGAPMPDGADAVVMVEETSITDDQVTIYKPVYPGAHVSAADSDIVKGIEMLEPNTLLTPPKVGVLAALGLDKIEVYCRTKAIIFPTGDEIIPPGNKLKYGKIYDINSYTVRSLMRSAGADVYIDKITGDTREELAVCIKKAREYDYAVFMGGSSVGERDLIHDMVSENGQLLFHGIALKPGKPTICGLVGNTMVFGMPGYPTSCLVNAYVLVLPSVRKMGRLPIENRNEEAILSENIVSTVGRHQIMTVKVEDGYAISTFKESGAITSMSYASGYIEIPANTEFLEKGAKVRVNYF